MSVDIRTLLKVLNHFHDELTACIHHKDKNGPFTVNDPILLGDFIVDAFNNYLRTAQSLTDDAMIRQIPPLAPVEPGLPDDPETVGRNPKTQKMTEVAMVTKSLILYLEGAIQTGANPARRGIPVVVSLLESIENQLIDLESQHQKACLQRNPLGGEYWYDTLKPVVELYNQALDIALENTDDPVISRLFQPLSTEMSDSFGNALSRAKVAQSALLAYLRFQTNHLNAREERPEK